MVRRWLAASSVVIAGLALLGHEALPRFADGAEDPRHAHHAMHDESLILERVWDMVDRGDLHHKIGPYPGLYPYVVALTRLVVGTDEPPRRAIVATRALSFVATVLLVLASFILFGRVADNPWVGALLALAMCGHPEIVTFASRVHPDALAALFTHVSLALLALSVDRGRRDDLRAATAFAALSAGTKLYGAFIMPAVFLAIARGAEDRRGKLREAARHLAMFGLIFVLCNPDLLKFPVGIVNGFLRIGGDNASHSGTPIDWGRALVDDDGLGFAGAAIATFGLAALAWRRRVDGRALIAVYVLGYLAFLVPTIRMVEARYLAPAMWPALFLGLAAIVPRTLADGRRVVAVAALLAAFLVFDDPRQNRRLDLYATAYADTVSPAHLELGRYLARRPRFGRGRIVSSPRALVPHGIPWQYVWCLEDIPFPDEAAAIVLDGELRRAPRGPNYAALVSGTRGFTATATIGEFVVYERR